MSFLAKIVLPFLSGTLFAVAALADDQVSFELDVQPVLTATGCNAGACHGKQRGQNGFQLSLLAYDPDYDFTAITKHARGRRIFPAVAEESLLLRKASATEPHGGGKRIEKDSAEYQLLLRWIEQGAQRSVADEPTLSKVALQESAFLLKPNQLANLSVVATYSDGSQRDVTNLATYLSNESAVAGVDDAGVVEAGALPGETAIMVRYMNHIEVANVVIPFDGSISQEFFASLTRNNFIDGLVYEKLKKTATKPSEPASDAVFLQRAYTDLIGRIPSADEAREFLTSTRQHRREYLIDELLAKPEYVDHWANKWMDMLRPNPYRVGIKAVLNYDNWIRQQFRDNVSYDEFARKLVTAKGSTWRNGAVTLYRDRRSPDEMATLISQLFLGVRLECAKCHHHPFENWSQEDFYQFSAFFARVKHKGTGLSPPISGGEETVFVSTKGDVRHPISGDVLEPEPLFGVLDSDSSESQDSMDRRQQLAAWMTSKNNLYFARVQVNRVWAELMGRGLVEPVDDLRSTNPASNPELLDALAKSFQDSDYDLKALLKQIAMSHVYSLSSIPNETNVGDRLNYSRHYRHRHRAEVLMDSIASMTETHHSLSGMPAGSRANQVWTHRVSSLFLDTFGRPDENQDPPCERTADSTVTQALHLMNSKGLDKRVRSDEGRAARLAKSKHSAGEIIEELYLSIFSRMPTKSELDYGTKLLQSASGDSALYRTRIEDLLWAMINSPECVIQN